MLHEEIFNLQQAIDSKIERQSNTKEENEYWMEWRVKVCKWLDISWHNNMSGHDDAEMEEILYALNND